MKSIIGDKPYMFGDTPTTYDASPFAALNGWETWPLEHPIRDYIRNDPILSSYVRRIRSTYFPDGGGAGALKSPEAAACNRGSRAILFFFSASIYFFFVIQRGEKENGFDI